MLGAQLWQLAIELATMRRWHEALSAGASAAEIFHRLGGTNQTGVEINLTVTARILAGAEWRARQSAKEHRAGSSGGLTKIAERLQAELANPGRGDGVIPGMAEAIEESRRQFVRHNPAGELYRQLTRTDPLAGEVPLPDAEHALTTQRRQAELDSDHLPGLAAVLSTHAMTLRSLGRHDEAQLSALEATDIYLRLVQDDPLTYEPMLVHAWVRTAVVLGELGIERVSVLDLAVTIRRRLAQRDPDHEPALAAELAILARALAKQGRWPEAVASGTESFEIRRQLGESELTGVADSLAATEEFLITHLAEAELGPEHLAALRNAVDAHPATVAAPVLERRV